MFRLRNLAFIAGVLCLGLSPALAMGHEEGEGGEHMGPPPAPESLRPILRAAIDNGDLSEEAETILLFLSLDPEDREDIEPPEPEEGEGPDVKEELMGLFKDILDDRDLPDDASEYLEKMLEHMEHEGRGDRGDRGDRSGQERRAELPEDVLEQLQAIRGLYRDVGEIQRDIRRARRYDEPVEELQDDRNEIVQDIVDSVVELLEVEVDNDNAGDILRVLRPSFGPKPRGGQRD